MVVEENDDIYERLLEPTKPAMKKSPEKKTVRNEMIFKLGTPGSVLGLHAMNGVVQKPWAKSEQRSEKQNAASSSKRSLRSGRKAASNTGRNKAWAPNGIKKDKSPTKRTIANKTINLK